MKQIKNLNNCKNIKVIATDIDGVLTDGGRYYTKTGEIMKKFHTVDGMGINLLLRNGIKTTIITKEKSPIVKKWAKDMNVSSVHSGIIKKEDELKKICKQFSCKPKEIAFIGDDVNDIELMKKIGFSAVPNDGNENVKKIVNYVCLKNGGAGAFREISDLILKIKFPKKTKWY